MELWFRPLISKAFLFWFNIIQVNLVTATSLFAIWFESVLVMAAWMYFLNVLQHLNVLAWRSGCGIIWYHYNIHLLTRFLFGRALCNFELILQNNSMHNLCTKIYTRVISVRRVHRKKFPSALFIPTSTQYFVIFWPVWSTSVIFWWQQWNWLEMRLFRLFK